MVSTPCDVAAVGPLLPRLIDGALLALLLLLPPCDVAAVGPLRRLIDGALLALSLPLGRCCCRRNDAVAAVRLLRWSRRLVTLPRLGCCDD
jgi:hypothetical protein